MCCRRPAVGAYLARRSFDLSRNVGTGFALYAAAELCYMTYHLDWTTFLFAHTISEVLVLVAVALMFLGVTRELAGAGRATR